MFINTNNWNQHFKIYNYYGIDSQIGLLNYIFSLSTQQQRFLISQFKTKFWRLLTPFSLLSSATLTPKNFASCFYSELKMYETWGVLSVWLHTNTFYNETLVLGYTHTLSASTRIVDECTFSHKQNKTFLCLENCPIVFFV